MACRPLTPKTHAALAAMFADAFDALEQEEAARPEQCQDCFYARHGGDGHCYMFAEMPRGACGQRKPVRRLAEGS